jgi:RNA polymerase sigma-70 factor (ECF subfamily)
MSMNVDEHPQLIRDAVAGDVTSLQRLLLIYYKVIEASVRSQIRGQVDGVIDADDIIQDVLFKIHRYIGTYRDQEHGGFSAWLRSISSSCVIDSIRRQQRMKRGGQAKQVRPSAASANESLDTIWDWVCPDSRSPDRRLRREEARQALQVCLSQLPSAQREAVVAHYFEHLDTSEIATRMSRTPGAVRELLRRARERLRELMGTASVWLSNR